MADFGYFAPRLAAAGYDPIPITTPCPGDPDAGKKPAIPQWQNGCPTDRRAEFAGCGTGILTRNTPSLDVDVLEPSVSAAIRTAADRVLGVGPIRVGNAPKCLMPFRLAGEPFSKLRVEWRKGLGADKHPPLKPPGVELLANGQQFVAFGTHPPPGTHTAGFVTIR